MCHRISRPVGQSTGLVRAEMLHRAPPSCRGVTLLEVIFSIGIIAVGLLGVLVLVPLAGSRSAQGMIADGADRMGRNAIRAFDVYQMRRPDSWAQLDPSGAQYIPFTGGEPFCIDPLYMAANTGTDAIFRFPYLDPAAPPPNVPYMKRVSLRAYPRASLPSTLLPGTTGSPVLSLNQAGQFFLGEDDLVFNLPKDRTMSPEQRFSFDDSAAPVTTGPLKRQWEGKFSWLATLIPNSVDTYLLSIVVFHRRDLAVDGERPSTVTFNSSGYNGGDVLLNASSPDDLKMKEGEWLMLAGVRSVSERHFRWYRIQTADAGPVENSGGGYERNLTLFGQDWPVTQLLPAYNKAIWIPGVVAVYEKTIRLETSSLWTDL